MHKLPSEIDWTPSPPITEESFLADMAVLGGFNHPGQAVTTARDPRGVIFVPIPGAKVNERENACLRWPWSVNGDLPDFRFASFVVRSRPYDHSWDGI